MSTDTCTALRIGKIAGLLGVLKPQAKKTNAAILHGAKKELKWIAGRAASDMGAIHCVSTPIRARVG